MKKAPRKAWLGVLDAVRAVAQQKTPFGSADVAKALGMAPGVASAWLGKFARWGYVLRVGHKSVKFGAGAPPVLFEVTRWGMEFRPGAKVTKMPERARLKVANPKKEKED